MIIDIRYHIASLAAVFLALAIGILIGMTMLGNDAIIEQQERLTSRLEEDLNMLRDEAQEVEETLKDYEVVLNNYKDFSNEVLPVLIQGRLEGNNVAIIETNIHTFSDDILNHLTLSGANLTSVTSFENPLTINSTAKEQIVTYLGIEEAVSTEDLEKIVSTQVSEAIRTGTNFELLTLLEDLEIIRLSGDYSTPINSVILIGGSQESENIQLEAIDIPIIKNLVNNDILVFGVENTNVTFSYIEEYKKYKISTIDHVDHVIGQVALIWAMDNNPGNYGFKETASDILPQAKKVNQ